MRLGNRIGGEVRPPSTDAFLDDVAPATGRVLATIPRSGPVDVDAAVAAARSAAPGWAATPVEARADLLDRIASALARDAERLAALESADQGKTITTARTIDIPRAVANFRFFAGAVRHQELPSHPMHGALNYTLRQPVGVAALITPWNLPLYLLSWKVAPALAMGNTVVCKPSELTPLTADALGALADEVGLPPGVLNVVHGLGGEAGQALVGHDDVDAISFTGGTLTGRAVAATAAPRFKKLSLELGGKNATIVFDDADLDLAVAGAVRAGFANQGEVCLCGSRVLVQRGVFDAFVERFVAAVQALRVGNPTSTDSDVGALISAAHRDKVEHYLRLAVEEGGTVRCGGDRPDLGGALSGGFFLEPAVVTGLLPSCRTATEEIFGPVVTVHPFDDEADAIAIANGTRYGLSASVWTTDLGRAHRTAAALDVGMVWVNTWLLRDLRVPFGGCKDSGVGREGGQWSLEFFSHAKNVCVKV